MAYNYLWSSPEVVYKVVHLACLQTKEVAPKIKREADTLESLKNFDILGIYKDGIPIGAFLFNGNEFHAAILPDHRGKWMNRKFIKIMLDEKEKRGGLFTVLSESSDMVKLSVLHFCNRYGIEVRYV